MPVIFDSSLSQSKIDNFKFSRSQILGTVTYDLKQSLVYLKQKLYRRIKWIIPISAFLSDKIIKINENKIDS